MNTSESCANIPILSINDLFKNCLLCHTGPGFPLKAVLLLKIKQNPTKLPKEANKKRAKGAK